MIAPPKPAPSLPRELLEGRGVGQRGGDLATEYIVTQLELRRQARGRRVQVPIGGIETQPDVARAAAAGSRRPDFTPRIFSETNAPRTRCPRISQLCALSLLSALQSCLYFFLRVSASPR